MKKMRCEICGSPDIKKVGDDLYECQSCGIQYAAKDIRKLLVDITGEVKIDRQAEVSNMITRAAQFESAGQYTKAQEYYNKALDIDAENESAHDGLNRINAATAGPRFRVVEPAISEKDGMTTLLQKLAVPKTPLDFYSEFRISAIKKKYCQFVYRKVHVTAPWSCVACHEYEENQTVYVTNYGSGPDKVPETKKIKRVERTPLSGTYHDDMDHVFSASDWLEREAANSGLNPELVSSFNDMHVPRFSDYRVTDVHDSDLAHSTEKQLYKGIEIDPGTSERALDKKIELWQDSLSSEIVHEVSSHVEADYTENWQGSFNCSTMRNERLYFPIMLIRYEYKTAQYIALINLADSDILIYTCPHDDSAELLAEIPDPTKKDGLSKGTTPAFWYWSLAGFAAMIVGCGLASLNFDLSTVLIPLGLSLAFVIIGCIRDRSIKNSYKKNLYQRDALLNRRQAQINESFSTFISTWNGDLHDLEKAQELLQKIDQHTISSDVAVGKVEVK